MTCLSVAAGWSRLARALVLEEPMLLAPGEELWPGSPSPFQEECRRLAEGMTYEEVLQLERELYPDANAAESRERALHLSRVDPAVFAGRGPIDRSEVESKLRRVRVPTIIIHGDRALGGIVSKGGLELAASVVPDLTVVRIPGIGHDVHWRRAAEFKSTVVDFLESLEGRPRS